ncbi:TPA: hypothetical protein EYP26_03240 [Candidatus Bathyarchaeota archaeon]|nr:hypothetical protein [Candidatus Bathyarchaeota archaeon]
MRCCFSCIYWSAASKKVPIDVRKKPKPGEFVEFRFGKRTVRIQAWDWEAVKQTKLSEIFRKRLCFYGKGIIEPWDECKNYKPRFKGGLTACQINVSRCEHASLCPKCSMLTKYIA